MRGPKPVSAAGLEDLSCTSNCASSAVDRAASVRRVRFSPPDRTWLIRPGETPMRPASSARVRPSWIVLTGTIAISLVSAYGFLMLRCRGTGNPFGRRARRWAITIVVITAAASTGVGLAAIAAGGHTIAAYVGLVLPSGLWLGRVSRQHSPRA